MQAVEDSLYNKDHVLKFLKDHYLKSQSRLKHYADLKRTEREFQVGELVLLKLQQYRQRSVRGATPSKLAARYFGPYRILERIGKVAYKLELPVGSLIHDVFHVSLLKRFVEKDLSSSAELPFIWEFE